jgi:tryptophan-rich sensory protein
MKIKNPKKLFLSILICEAAGIIGSFFTAPSIRNWYIFLKKPFFSPPNWLFGPVWLMLYLMMGISVYFIWEKGIKQKKIKQAITVFGIHLILNALWSILFFGLRNPLLGFINIVFLWLMIIIVMKKFWYIKKETTYLLIPYLLWVSFATMLNFAIIILN